MKTLSPKNIFDLEAVRADFPLFQQPSNHSLIYFDNAATTQKPRSVISAVADFYLKHNANIHRGVYPLSEQATLLYEEARVATQKFIHAKSNREIIFTRGTTESINLVAQGWQTRLKAGDEIIVTALEHHSNLVPWQVACEKTGATLRVVAINEKGELNLNHYQQLLNARTRLVAVSQVSNALGTISPIKEMIALAHQLNVPVLVDGAQATPHRAVNVQELDCDFYAFSGHKMYGPTGIGVLYGKEKYLEQLPPYQTGGGMISQVYFTHTHYSDLPDKFEAGTPNIEGAIGLHAALTYLQKMGMKNIADYEHKLLQYATQQLSAFPDIKIIGNADEKAAVISFVMDNVHPHDVGTIIASEGIAVRVGHHCCMPLMECLGLPATVRASFGLYNTVSEIDKFILALDKVRKIFS